MSITVKQVKELLKEFNFRDLFLELNYDASVRPQFTQEVGPLKYRIEPIAESGGLTVLEATPIGSDKLPQRQHRAALDRAISALFTENLLIFVNEARTESYFQRAAIVRGKRVPRGHRYLKGAPLEPLARSIRGLQLPFEVFDDNGNVAITDVTDRLDQSGLFADSVTRKFFKEFSDLRKDFVQFLSWISDEGKRDWYCSVLLNRLMFIYFVAEKGLLPEGKAFLRNNLEANARTNGKDTFYTHFLLPLSFFGFGEKQGERGRFETMFREVLYLNGGLFTVHTIERELGIDKRAVEDGEFSPKVRIPDQEFQRWMNYFDRWQWTLDEEKVENDGYISPHILGYIFEKYINQKQMGAYYTKEDITGYICRNTILPRLFDMLAESGVQGNLAVNPLPIGPHPNLLNDGKGISQGEGIDRYVYSAVRSADYLATETDFEYSQRQDRYEAVLQAFEDGEISGIDDFITYNLDIERLSKDFVETIQDPVVLHSFYFNCLQQITVLDPTCGSGAFLFAALNILYPLYETALKRMRYLVGKATGIEPDVANWRGELHFDDVLVGQGVFAASTSQFTVEIEEMRNEVERINLHPSPEYFFRKSIIVNNLFGVDIMEEAVEICKLRLFLTLVASADADSSLPNLGIEPLPDIDFNVISGNALVGFTTRQSVDVHFGSQGSLPLIWAEQVILDRLVGKLEDYAALSLIGMKDDPLKRDIEDQKQAVSAGLNYELMQARKITDSEGFQESHKPFHWLVQFPAVVLNREGFDVVVGNPPYVETRKITEYLLNKHELRTFSCGNLLAHCSERSIDIARKNGRLGLVLLVSTFSTERMEPLQEQILKHCSSWISNFAWRPAKLFDGANVISALWIARKANAGVVRSSKYYKWYSDERSCLFNKLTYGDVTPYLSKGCFPKIASLNDEAILAALRNQTTPFSSYFNGTDSSRSVFYFRGMLYWIKALTFLPVHRVDGVSHISGQCKTLMAGNQITPAAAVAIICSSLFFWYYQSFSDCQQINKREFDGFHLDLTPSLVSELDRFGASLMQQVQSESRIAVRNNSKTGEVVEKQYFYFSRAKNIIDQIDQALCEHLQLPVELRDHILNYDIKYRLGAQSEENE